MAKPSEESTGVTSLLSKEKSFTTRSGLQSENSSGIGKNHRFAPEWDDSSDEDISTPRQRSQVVSFQFDSQASIASPHLPLPPSRRKSVEMHISAAHHDQQSLRFSLDSDSPRLGPGDSVFHSAKLRRKSAMAAVSSTDYWSAADHEGADHSPSTIKAAWQPSPRTVTSTGQECILDSKHSIASTNPLFEGLPADQDSEEDSPRESPLVPSVCAFPPVQDLANLSDCQAEFDDSARESVTSFGTDSSKGSKGSRLGTSTHGRGAGLVQRLLLMLSAAVVSSTITWLIASRSPLQFGQLSLFEHAALPSTPTPAIGLPTPMTIVQPSTVTPPMPTLRVGQQATLTTSPTGELMWVVLVPATTGASSADVQQPAPTPVVQTTETIKPSASQPAAMPQTPTTPAETAGIAATVDKSESSIPTAMKNTKPTGAAAPAAAETEPAFQLPITVTADQDQAAAMASTQQVPEPMCQQALWPDSRVLIAMGMGLVAIAISMIVMSIVGTRQEPHRQADPNHGHKFARLMNLLRLRNGRVVDVWG